MKEPAYVWRISRAWKEHDATAGAVPPKPDQLEAEPLSSRAAPRQDADLCPARTNSYHRYPANTSGSRTQKAPTEARPQDSRGAAAQQQHGHLQRVSCGDGSPAAGAAAAPGTASTQLLPPGALQQHPCVRVCVKK